MYSSAWQHGRTCRSHLLPQRGTVVKAFQSHFKCWAYMNDATGTTLLPQRSRPTISGKHPMLKVWASKGGQKPFHSQKHIGIMVISQWVETSQIKTEITVLDILRVTCLFIIARRTLYSYIQFCKNSSDVSVFCSKCNMSVKVHNEQKYSCQSLPCVRKPCLWF